MSGWKARSTQPTRGFAIGRVASGNTRIMCTPALHDFLELPLASQQLNRSICRLCQLREPPHRFRTQVGAEELFHAVCLKQPRNAQPGGPKADHTELERAQLLLDLKAAWRADALQENRAKGGAIAYTTSTMLSTIALSTRIGMPLTPTRLAKSAAVPSITGSATRRPVLPKPRMTDPTVTIPTAPDARQFVLITLGQHNRSRADC